jgi:raffinose/stachyose/melibiose transport system substrate-binding protein
VNSIDGAQQRQVFMNGKAAMTHRREWAVAELDANTRTMSCRNIRIAALPAVHGGKGDPNAISGDPDGGLR